MTSLDFLKALSVPAFLILLINQELKILTPSRTFTISINLKTPFLSKPFISLRQDSINNGKVYSGVVISGFVRVSLININTSTVFCWSLVNSHYVRFDLRRGALATSSSLGSSVSSLVGSSVSSWVGSSVSSLVNSSSLGSSGLGYRYSFTIVVLKSV